MRPKATVFHTSLDSWYKFDIRKQLQFSLLNAQDTVKISEFQVTHRDLYTATDRVPVKDGVLDRRLVGMILSVAGTGLFKLYVTGNDGEERILRDVWAVVGRLCWSLRVYQAGGPSVSYWLLQTYHNHPPVYLQGTPNYIW